MIRRPSPPLNTFYVTAPLPCPYVPGRIERRVVTELGGSDPDELHDRLSRVGFRRSHNVAYTPVCPGCNACQAVRIVVQEYAPTRSLRRVARRNADLLATVRAPVATPEQYAVFSAYQRSRHGEGEMAQMDFFEYRAMIEETPVATRLGEFRLADRRLAACCLVDELVDGFSAVYSFFDPELAGRSLGTYMIQWLIAHAQGASLPYAYLGYWIAESRKMAYKARFRPLEMYAPGGWRRLDGAAGALADADAVAALASDSDRV